MVIRVLLLVALSGFVLGSVGGWEAGKANTELALEKWKNYRAGTSVISWPVQFEPGDVFWDAGRSYLPNFHRTVGEFEKDLRACPGVVAVESDLYFATLIIKVKTAEVDLECLTNALPPLRQMRPEEYQVLLKQIRDRKANPGPPC